MQYLKHNQYYILPMFKCQLALKDTNNFTTKKPFIIKIFLTKYSFKMNIVNTFNDSSDSTYNIRNYYNKFIC
jgi:hypothetical protein